MERLLNEIIAKHPKSEFATYSLFRLAYIRFHKGKYDECLKILNNLKNAIPKPSGTTAVNVETYEIWALVRKGDAKAALTKFAKTADNRALLAAAPLSFLCDLGAVIPPSDIKTAEFCFNRVISESKNKQLRQKALIALADAEIKGGDAVKAMDALKRAIKLDASPSQTASARLALAKILVERDESDTAVLLLEKCLDTTVSQETLSDARLTLAKALAGNPKRLASAKRYAIGSYIMSENETTIVEGMFLGMKLSLKLGDREDAEKIWNEFAKRFPKRVNSKKAIAMKKEIFEK